MSNITIATLGALPVLLLLLGFGLLPKASVLMNKSLTSNVL